MLVGELSWGESATIFGSCDLNGEPLDYAMRFCEGMGRDDKFDVASIKNGILPGVLKAFELVGSPHVKERDKGTPTTPVRFR
jgi:hypothetical protein